jgi:hypothetical protein
MPPGKMFDSLRHTFLIFILEDKDCLKTAALSAPKYHQLTEEDTVYTESTIRQLSDGGELSRSHHGKKKGPEQVSRVTQ